MVGADSVDVNLMMMMLSMCMERVTLSLFLFLGMFFKETTYFLSSCDLSVIGIKSKSKKKKRVNSLFIGFRSFVSLIVFNS